jgi:hypothetical protein
MSQKYFSVPEKAECGLREDSLGITVTAGRSGTVHTDSILLERKSFIFERQRIRAEQTTGLLVSLFTPSKWGAV